MRNDKTAGENDFALFLRHLGTAALSLALVHCGGSIAPGGPGGDGSGSGSATSSTSDHDSSSSGPAPGSVVGDCGPGGSCPTNSSCYYAIGSCDAKPQCVEDPAPGTPECGAIGILCGCEGQEVYTGCGYPEGYASGPTTGNGTACEVSPPVDVDGGEPVVFDSGGPTQLEAGPPAIDGNFNDGAWIDEGPCGAGGTCVGNATCYYPIGTCGTTSAGRCFDEPGETCGVVEELCGCNDQPVTTGCDAPQGYATGPTDGTSNPLCGADAGGQQQGDAAQGSH